jgi:sugar phosphate isomerase/epimerase
MRLCLSVNLSDILTEKKSVLENLFSWGSIFDNDLHFGRIFSLIKEKNLQGIELVASKDIKRRDLEKLKTILRERSVFVFSLHQPILSLYKISAEAIKRLFETASALSAKIIVLHLFALGKKINDANFIRSLKSLEEKYNIKIGIENGSKNIFLGLRPSCYSEEGFSETVSKLGLGITFDVSHLAQATGGDIIAFYKKNKERIMNIHLSDYKSKIFKHNLFNMHLPLGKGTLPMEGFLKILKEDNYDGLLTLEINRGTKEIKESIDFVRQSLKQD